MEKLTDVKGLNLRKLVENADLQEEQKLRDKAVLAFGGIFGAKPYDGWGIFNPRNWFAKPSQPYTKKEIAEILFKNRLVNNLEEGLNAVDYILTEKFHFGEWSENFFSFEKCKGGNGEVKYELAQRRYLAHDF